MSRVSSDLAEKGVDEKPPHPAIPYTFILIVLVCMSSISANALATSFTITQFHSYGNGSASDFYTIYDFEGDEDEEGEHKNITFVKRSFLSNGEKSSLIMVVPIGALLSIFPIASSYKHFGFRRTFASCLVLSSITSSLLPFVTNSPLYSLAIIIRIIQGISFGAFLPVIAKVGSYLSIEDFTLTTVLLFSYLQFSAMIIYPISGFLCYSSLGWHSVHYIFSGITMILTIIFIFYHYTEMFQRTIRQSRLFEVFYGTMAEHCSSSILTFHLPYLSIYQDLSFWAIVMGAFGYFTALQMSLQYIPLYLNKVVNLSIISTGLLSALPLLLGFTISVASTLKFLPFQVLKNNKLLRVRVYNSISTVIPGILCLIIAFIDPNRNPTLSVALYTLASSFLGFAGGGFFSAIRYRSGSYSVFVVANIHAVCLVSGFFVSLLNTLIARAEEYNEWSPLFIVEGIMLIVYNILFCIFVNTDKAEWTKEGYEDTSFGPKRKDPLPQRPL